MTTVPDPDIDAEILSAASDKWQKVAMIVAKVMSRHSEQTVESEYDLVARRIGALVNDGRLESQGDVSNWRRSEVRLTK
ncbi:MAG TPA: DUF3658 domain-containing protein [Xanthobacteraceae bacterium]|nr:DUF3658 domain-containing protein [Xanthobacteraceae bacterium]